MGRWEVGRWAGGQVGRWAGGEVGSSTSIVSIPGPVGDGGTLANDRWFYVGCPCRACISNTALFKCPFGD